jgi:hypothetical protein
MDSGIHALSSDLGQVILEQKEILYVFDSLYTGTTEDVIATGIA